MIDDSFDSDAINVRASTYERIGLAAVGAETGDGRISSFLGRAWADGQNGTMATFS